MNLKFHPLNLGVILLIGLAVIGCSQQKVVPGYGSARSVSSAGWRFDFDDSIGFTGRDTLWTEYTYNNLTTPVEGKVALDLNGKSSLLRTGPWKDFDQSGQLLREGDYRIGRYVNCCAHGPCSDFYNYRTGPWTFWYPNGQVRAQGNFAPKRRNLETACKGGDWLWFGEIDTATWKFYLEEGTQWTPSFEEIRLLERVVFDLGKYSPLVTLGRGPNNKLVLGNID